MFLLLLSLFPPLPPTLQTEPAMSRSPAGTGFTAPNAVCALPAESCVTSANTSMPPVSWERGSGLATPARYS